jgi:Tfp pilus assembly protein PilF
MRRRQLRQGDYFERAESIVIGFRRAITPMQTELLFARTRARFLLCFVVVAMLVWFGGAGAARAQQSSATVDVRVTESNREEAVEQAEVRLHVFGHPSPTHRAYTDGNGRVIFYGVERGSYYLEVQKDGFEPYREQVDVPGGLSQNFFVRLRQKDVRGQPAPGGAVSAAMLIPGPARKAYDEAMAKLKTNPAESVSLLRRAVELYPKFPEAWAMLGLVYTREKKYKDAQAALEKSIQLNPRDSTPHIFLGKLFLEEKDFAKAEAKFLETMRLDPQAWDAPYELARCYFNMGKLDRALEYARKAQTLPQAASTTHLLLADIFLRRSEPANALHELEEFARIDPQSPFIERVRAKIAQLKKSPTP